VKLNTIAGFVLLSLAPALSHAGAVNWTSQEYNIYAYLDIDDPEQPFGSPQLNTTAFSLAGLPNISTASLTSDNGVARADLGIKNLSNSTHDIVELSLNAFSSYNDGTKATQYSNVVPSVTLDNTFKAVSNTLKVAYDFTTTLNFYNPQGSANPNRPTANQYQLIMFNLENLSTGVVQEWVNFDQYYFTSVPSSLDPYIFTGSDAFEFNVTPETSYRIRAEIAPDMFSSGTIGVNNSQSTLKISLSNSVSAVPEPETYAMLLAGLVLVGFSARRQTQA